MEIVWLQVLKLLMARAVSRYAQMLLKTQTLIKDANRIHTIVLQMAQDASNNNQLVKQHSFLSYVRVIQVVHLAKFVWIGPLVLITIINHYDH